ncbi:MAG: Rrf2 family transcriptional regulator [Rhizobiaceae bacterium]|nr:Rrf2 family transcriptional regulator [Rhizobiaceae bacterium]
MKQDGRLARMVHVLVHMGLLGGRETSDTIARMLNTNPVVVRRLMGLMKSKGIVDSEGGRGGGWTLQRSLADLTILDIQAALVEGPVLSAGVSRDHPSCPVERATNATLTTAFNAVEIAIRGEFSRVTLAEIARTATAGSVGGGPDS